MLKKWVVLGVSTLGKKAEIIIVNTTELKPDAKYIIGINRRYITVADTKALIKQLNKMGIKNAVGIMSYNPDEAIKIIEQKDTENLL